MPRLIVIAYEAYAYSCWKRDASAFGYVRIFKLISRMSVNKRHKREGVITLYLDLYSVFIVCLRH